MQLADLNKLKEFLSRQHAMRGERDIVIANPSVCLFLCPSNADIVSKRIDILSDFIDDPVGTSF